jgi:peptidoglycan/xylan/chitin deacetylase (PgdA/CDA1 family)
LARGTAIVVAALALLGAAPLQRSQDNQIVHVHVGAAAGRVVALSFDDGPNPAYTPTVLRLLAAHHARATFFLEGQFVEQWPDLARSVQAQGHEIGNHTWNHPDVRVLGRGGVQAQVRRTSAAFTAAGLKPSDLFRPPKGNFNPVADRAVRAIGLRTAGWTPGLCVEKYLRHDPPGEAMRRMVDRVRPGDILLAHDGGIPSRARTMDALPLLLAGLEARGFRVVTVGDLLGTARS